ncbi:hypothetical protein [Pleionea litopenaei]|uniref:Uncharacterized protein n=1 Tax=Pleionea litopenaei TaxID=3070815 RepID=A0AA51RT49_9GAMM|nr:hypothetical protein [Pleionea sp. HL-JVS1]WMS86989.1 hypothetical protein Q9312_17380 [Pleionea sp. HL-JVS1]
MMRKLGLILCCLIGNAFAANLDGLWLGSYYYDRPTSGEEGAFDFSIVFEQETNSFTGKALEPRYFGDGQEAALIAKIKGKTDGKRVWFDKTYDGSAGQTHTVKYELVIQQDETMMLGSWSIPGTERRGKVKIYKVISEKDY